jgi:hypothetical protein
MAKLLTRLKISEVSAVDRGAGEDCRILLRKRDQDAIAKATEALKESVHSIMTCDDDDEVKRAALVETFGQFESYLDRNVAGSKASLSKGPLEKAERARREKFEKIFAGKADDDNERITKADRAGGHHSLASAVVEHALDRLDHLRQKHGFEKAHTAKEITTMDNQELTSILKQDGGLGAVCKRIFADGASGISENEFVSAVTEHARERFADLPADVAFSKLYEGDVMLRKALRVLRDGAWGYASAG